MRNIRKIFLGCAAFMMLGAVVATAQVKMIVVAGQSNAVGYGSSAYQLPANMKKALVKVLFNFEEGTLASVSDPSKRISSGGWRPLAYQTDINNSTFGPFSNGFGFEMRMGHQLVGLLYHDIAILKFAFNMTTLAEEWNPSTPGSLYDELLDRIQQGLTGLTDLGLDPELAGVCWMHGEWDARDSDFAAQYGTNLTAFIQQLRADTEIPDLPFVIGRINENSYLSIYGITQANMEAVRAAQQSVADTLPNVSVIYTEGLELNEDKLHFKASGQLGLGLRFAVGFRGLTPEYPPINITDVDTTVLSPGQVVQHSVTGPAGAAYSILMSSGGGPLLTPWGIAGLDLPVVLLLTASVGPDGYSTIPLELIDPGPGIYRFYTHVIVLTAPPQWAIGGNNPNGTQSIMWTLYSP